MWEQFTPRMRQALAAAEVEAERLGRKPLRTDFLLLAVAIAEESGSTALSDLGLTADQVRVEVATSIPPDEVSTQLKRCVREAVNRARLEGEEFAGSEHLVAAVRATAGSGQTMLGRLGRDPLPASPQAPEMEFKPRLAADPLAQRGLGPEEVVLASRVGLDGLWAGVSLALSGLALGLLSGKLASLLRHPPRLGHYGMTGAFIGLTYLVAFLIVWLLITVWLWKGTSAFGFRRLILHGEVICDLQTGRVWVRRRLLGWTVLRSLARLAELDFLASDYGRHVALQFPNCRIHVQCAEPRALAVKLGVPLVPEPTPGSLISWYFVTILLVAVPVLLSLAA